MLVLFAGLSYEIVPKLVSGCTVGFVQIHHQMNLDAILKEWQQQCGSGTIDCWFDVEKARTEMPRRLSYRSENAQIWAKLRFLTTFGPIMAASWIPCLIGMLFALTFRPPYRRRIVVASAIALGIAVGAAFSTNRLADMRYRGSHAFLNDFEYLIPPFPKLEYDTRGLIVCYEKKGRFRQDHILAGRSDGRIEHVSRFDFDDATATRVFGNE